MYLWKKKERKRNSSVASTKHFKGEKKCDLYALKYGTHFVSGGNLARQSELYVPHLADPYVDLGAKKSKFKVAQALLSGLNER